MKRHKLNNKVSKRGKGTYSAHGWHRKTKRRTHSG